MCHGIVCHSGRVVKCQHCHVQGNVVLTDSKYEVLTLLRSHRDDDKGMALMPRHPYPIHTIRLRTPLDAAQLSAALSAADAKATVKGAPEIPHAGTSIRWIHHTGTCLTGVCSAQLPSPGRKGWPDVRLGHLTAYIL